MKMSEMKEVITEERPPEAWTVPLKALWWDAKGDWSKAHGLMDELETPEAMAVHAYLHRKEGAASNADYWYRRAGRTFQRDTLDEEWMALAEHLLSGA